MRETIKNFAGVIAKILKTDRWVLVAIDGEMGEGKSCFSSILAQEVAKKTKTKFSYEHNMTFQRKELKNMVDGKNKKKEYSVILADELISMFFKRNWYDSEQIDGIELLNKCRDRHLCVIGNIPSFWDLDSAIFSVIRFWVHIHERGDAWVFQKTRNPFTEDKWHKKKNEKAYDKKDHPYQCKGFVCTIKFSDWSSEEKKEYYRIRNIKRVGTEGQRDKRENYALIKTQRDSGYRFLFDYNNQVIDAVRKLTCKICRPKFHGVELHKPFTNKAIGEVTGLSQDAIRLIRMGLK